MSDFDDIRNLGMPDYAAAMPDIAEATFGIKPSALSGQSETDTAVAKLRDTQSRMVAQQRQGSPFQLPPGVGGAKITRASDGSTTMDFTDVDPRLLQDLLKAKTDLDKIRGSFAMEAARLQGQIQQREQQPWMQLSTALSSNLAQAHDMPGWVQALGRTAEQISPPLDVLRARRLGVLGEEAKMTEKDIALSEVEYRTRAAALDRTERAEILRQNAETRRRSEEATTAAKEAETTNKKMELGRKMIKDAGGEVDASKFKGLGLDEEHVDLLKEEASGVKKQEDFKDKQKKDLAKIHNEGITEVQRMKGQLRKEIEGSRTSSPEARAKLILDHNEKLANLEGKLADAENKIQQNIFSTPEEKEAAVKRYIEFKKQVDLVSGMVRALGQPGLAPAATAAPASGEVAGAKAAKVGDIVTIGGKRYKKTGPNNYVLVSQ